MNITKEDRDKVNQLNAEMALSSARKHAKEVMFEKTTLSAANHHLAIAIIGIADAISYLHINEDTAKMVTNKRT